MISFHDTNFFKKIIHVDVILPVHNASQTIEETVHSILHQTVPVTLLYSDDAGKKNVGRALQRNRNSMYDMNIVLDTYPRCVLKDIQVNITICCYDDGSTDDSWNILLQLQQYVQHSSSSLEKIFSVEYEDDHDGHSKVVNRDSNVIYKFQMVLGRQSDGIARGAATARNRAVQFKNHHPTILVENNASSLSYLCFIDSDDIMHPHRIAQQLSVMLAMDTFDQNLTLLGCTFDRIPQDSTWHYTQWANTLSDERLVLEQFREITVIQPTWFMTRSRFESLGGYMEVATTEWDHDHPSKPHLHSEKNTHSLVYRLIHEVYDTEHTLKLAEDLRFFYAHLSYPYESSTKDAANEKMCTGKNDTIRSDSSTTTNMNTTTTMVKAGSIKLIKTSIPLMTYRHREGQSQSSMTSRKLLLQLRVKAFMDLVVQKNLFWQYDPMSDHNNEQYPKQQQGDDIPSQLHQQTCASNGFVIWGAGRDGKEFLKSLSWNDKRHVRCFVDVDEKKINCGYYVMPMPIPLQQREKEKQNKKHSKKIPKSQSYKVPIVHFSMLIRDDVKRKEVQHEYLKGTNGTASLDCQSCDGNIDGRITKAKISSSGIHHIINQAEDEMPRIKKQKLTTILQRKLHAIHENDVENRKLLSILPQLPVVVCVAMYRSNGALERNVECIGRKEGVDLWHFS